MTDEIKTESAAAPDEGATPEPVADNAAALREALAKQGSEYKAQIAELAAFKAEHEAAATKQAEAEAIAKQDFEKVLSTRDEKLNEANAKLEQLNRKIVEGQARESLRSMGLDNDLMIRGAIADLPAEATAETLAEWAEAFKTANADYFVEPVKPVKQSGVGSPSVGAGADLKSRLNSTDMEVKRAALKEQLQGQMSGTIPV